jgi:hypothetical protein
MLSKPPHEAVMRLLLSILDDPRAPLGALSSSLNVRRSDFL